MIQELAILRHDRKKIFLCCNAILHAPRVLANIQTCLKQRTHTVSGTMCYLAKLDGECSVSYAAPKQGDSKVCVIAKKLLSDRSRSGSPNHTT